jgi:NADH:ubiquinone oxidoreductase subunit E
MFIKEYLRKNHLEDSVVFHGSRCLGRCSNGPNLVINGIPVMGVSLSTIEGILEKEFGRIA